MPWQTRLKLFLRYGIFVHSFRKIYHRSCTATDFGYEWATDLFKFVIRLTDKEKPQQQQKKFQRTQLYLAHSPFLVSAHCPLIGALLSPHKHLNRSSVSLTQLVLGMELQSLCVVQSLAFAVNEDEKKDFIYAERFYASVYSLNETK